LHYNQQVHRVTIAQYWKVDLYKLLTTDLPQYCIVKTRNTDRVNFASRTENSDPYGLVSLVLRVSK
jgi:hypothetical protein